MTWEEVLRTRSLNITAHCRNSRNAPPRAAICIAGAARAFASPLAMAGFEHSVLGALGGSTATRFFLQLKTVDSAKRDGWFGSYAAHHEAISSAGVIQNSIAARPWLVGRMGEAVIVNGSGAYLGVGSIDGATPIRVVEPDEFGWRDYAPAHCGSQSQITTKSYLHSRLELTEARMERQLRFYLSQEWCRLAIRRHEVRTGKPFEVVMFSRPDLLWFRPMPAYCDVDFATQTTLSCPTMGCDEAWTTPRRLGPSAKPDSLLFSLLTTQPLS